MFQQPSQAWIKAAIQDEPIFWEHTSSSPSGSKLEAEKVAIHSQTALPAPPNPLEVGNCSATKKFSWEIRPSNSFITLSDFPFLALVWWSSCGIGCPSFISFVKSAFWFSPSFWVSRSNLATSEEILILTFYSTTDVYILFWKWTILIRKGCWPADIKVEFKWKEMISYVYGIISSKNWGRNQRAIELNWHFIWSVIQIYPIICWFMSRIYRYKQGWFGWFDKPYHWTFVSCNQSLKTKFLCFLFAFKYLFIIWLCWVAEYRIFWLQYVESGLPLVGQW